MSLVGRDFYVASWREPSPELKSLSMGLTMGLLLPGTLRGLSGQLPHKPGLLQQKHTSQVNQSKIPNWAHAARIAFSILPSSAPCERVFSLVESMFGTEQLHVLGDQLQGSVMLCANKRAVG